MNRNTFCKAERLHGKKPIDELFSGGSGSFLVFPFRVIFMEVEPTGDYPVAILISVPKKRVRRATKRNLVKRQIRESYRLNKHELACALNTKGKGLAVALIYLSAEILPTVEINRKLKAVLDRIREKTA